MAGIMDEYDPPTPLNKTYCARLKVEEYDNQAYSCTERSLLELMQHLENTPETYHNVLNKRKKEEIEDDGFLSYLKTKMWYFLYPEDQIHVSNDQCHKELSKLTTDIVKVFNYAQESKGRRHSKRLAERKLKGLGFQTTPESRHLSGPDGKCNTPLIPPPPPPQLPSRVTPYATATLARRPLTDCNKKQLNEKHKISSQASLQDVLQELKNHGKTALCSREQKSPGGTPLAGWPKKRCDSNVGFFNTKLVDKFKNIDSPVSPLVSSPGYFESESPVKSFANSSSSS